MNYYSEAFKRKMVQKLSIPGAKSAGELSEEVGVAQSSLSRWLREARSIGEGIGGDKEVTVNGDTNMKRRPQDWSTEEKLRVVVETRGLTGEGLGAYLRRQGLHEAIVLQWRRGIEEALSGKRGTGRAPEDIRRIKQLERELTRKEKALAETAALLVLQKKVQALWGEEECDMKGSNER